MPEYVYRAITKDGVIVRNRIDSSSKQNLIKKLKEGDLTPITIVQIGYKRRKNQRTTVKKHFLHKKK